MQMFRQHQIRTPGMLDGMALSFSQEALRALQNAFPVHEVVRCEYATDTTLGCLREEGVLAYCSYGWENAADKSRRLRLVGLDTMAYSVGMEMVLLDRRRGMGA